VDLYLYSPYTSSWREKGNITFMRTEMDFRAWTDCRWLISEVPE